MALPIRLANTWRNSSGSQFTVGSRGATVQYGASFCGSARMTSATSCPKSTSRRLSVASLARDSASSASTSLTELMAWPSISSSMRCAWSWSPAASWSRASRVMPTMPPSGPRRSCETLRLKLSRPSMVSRSSAVRSAT